MLLRDTILVVEDASAIRSGLRNIFESQFNILEAATLSQAELLFRENHSFIVAVLVDMELLESSRAENLAWLDEPVERNHFPVIAIVGTDDMQNEHRAYELGADEVVFRPLHPMTVERRINALVGHYRSKWALEEQVKEQAEVLRCTNETIVDSLASVIEYRSSELGMHTLRIRRFTQILLEELERSCPEYGLTPEVIAQISSAASLHDIGKIAISDEILAKPGKLDKAEVAIMKSHTVVGSEMLTKMSSLGSAEYMRYAYNICRYHHERWGGEGYPEGLEGDDIPICAQVVGLADCYDALTTQRGYKSAFSYAEAANMILNGECGSFSPVLLECFKEVRQRLEVLSYEYADGHSPKDDAIRAPLASPAPTAAGSLQRLTSKYSMLLRYLNSTVMDFDLEKKVYHLIYNADPDIDIVAGDELRGSALDAWSRHIYDMDGKPVTKEGFEPVREFYTSGLRQQSFPIQLRDKEGQLRPYTATLLRPDVPEEQRLTVVFKRQDKKTENEEHEVDSAVDALARLAQICIYDGRLTMVGVSSELLHFTGYTEGEILEKSKGSLIELIPEAERAAVELSLSEQLADSLVCSIKLPLMKKNGGTAWLMAKGCLSEENGIEQLAFIPADISSTEDEVEELRLALEKQNLIISQSDDVIFELDLVSDQLVYSGEWEQRFGYAPLTENVTTDSGRASHFHPDDLPVFYKKMGQLREGTSFVEFNVRVVDAGGRYRWNRIRAALQRDERGRPSKAVGVFTDIDDEQRASWAVQETAKRDALTKLLNKVASQQETRNYLAIREKNAIAVLAVIDLDNFKMLNDSYGHMMGDVVLGRVSAEISRMFRGTDIVGRIGGDEFMVFLPEVPSRKMAVDRFMHLCESLRTLLGEYTVEGGLSCSIGMAFAPEHGSDYEELFRKADRALYEAKHMGKGRCCVYDSDIDIVAFPTTIGRRIDSDEQPGLANESLIHYAFDMLYESGDTVDTINKLMATVGKQVGVSRVYIFENNVENTTCSNTFEWCAEGVEPQIDALQELDYEQDLNGVRESFNERGIFYTPDVTRLPQHLRDILEPQGIKAMLLCAIIDKGVFSGYVGFDDNTKVRLWTQEQIGILSTLAQVISVFLLKHRMQERTDTLVSEMDAILDKQADCIYVVDEESYRLRFINGKLMGREPESAVGMLCYEALRGESKPCDICPLHSEGKSCMAHNERHGINVHLYADSIHWENKPAWMVTCIEEIE